MYDLLQCRLRMCETEECFIMIENFLNMGVWIQSVLFRLPLDIPYQCSDCHVIFVLGAFIQIVPICLTCSGE